MARRVHPWGVFLQRSHWYLVAFDLDRNDLRLFRLSRMTDPQMNTARPNSPDYEIPEDFELSTFTGRDAWDLPGDEAEPMDAEVDFVFPLSLWAERNEVGELLEARTDGSQRRAFRVRDEGPFLRWILGLGREATVTAPDALVDGFQDLTRRVAALYADPGEARG